MKCLTPEKALSGQCGFMAANMYARCVYYIFWRLSMVPSLTIYSRSIFGENALANLSIEKPMDDKDAKVTGHIRIRAKSQVGLFLPHKVLLDIVHKALNWNYFPNYLFFRVWLLV